MDPDDDSSVEPDISGSVDLLEAVRLDADGSLPDGPAVMSGSR